jgi:hypothetical protein
MTDLSWLEDYGENDYEGYDMSLLKMDEAYLSVSARDEGLPYRIYRKHVECIKCPFVKLEQLSSDDSIIVDGLRIVLQKTPNNIYRISTQDADPLASTDPYLCEFGEEFGEFGIYNVTVTPTGCAVDTIKNAVSIGFPVLTVFLIYCALFLGVFGVVYAGKRLLRKNDAEEKKKVEAKKRVKAIDTFRG